MTIVIHTQSAAFHTGTDRTKDAAPECARILRAVADRLDLEGTVENGDRWELLDVNKQPVGYARGR